MAACATAAVAITQMSDVGIKRCDEFKNAAYAHDNKAVQHAASALLEAGLMLTYGYEAIHAIATNPDPQALALMVKYKADINLVSYAGQSALFIAISQRNREAILLLLRYGIDVNIKDWTGETALHWLCVHPSPVDNKPWLPYEIATLLLRAGADVNARDSSDVTPLYSISSWASVDLMRLFIVDYKAQINARSYYMSTPLNRAVSSTSEDRMEILQLMVDHGADVNEKCGTRKRTVLMEAAMRPSLKPVLQFLLRDECAVDMEAKDADGRTALSHARRNEAFAILKAALHRRRQLQRITILMMSIRATRGVGTFRYSILPLVRSIMALVDDIEFY